MKKIFFFAFSLLIIFNVFCQDKQWKIEVGIGSHDAIFIGTEYSFLSRHSVGLSVGSMPFFDFENLTSALEYTYSINESKKSAPLRAWYCGSRINYLLAVYNIENRHYFFLNGFIGRSFNLSQRSSIDLDLGWGVGVGYSVLKQGYSTDTDSAQAGEINNVLPFIFPCLRLQYSWRI